MGRDLAPRVARRLGTGLTADCTELAVEAETRLLLQTRPAFGENVIATIVTPHNLPQMATVRPGVMSSLERDPDRTGEVVRIAVELSPEDDRVRVLNVVREAKAQGGLEEAGMIVAGGKGLGAAENFRLVEELAEALGAAVGASRDAVEAGWISSDHQVGQTGRTVRPRLYIACGISGAVQHVAGMRESEVIVAINIDRHAPIFEIADYGIVGDVREILPALTEALRSRYRIAASLAGHE